MSQTLVDFSGNPSGAELMDDYLTPMQENILTSNSGTTRPGYAKEGTKWIDKTQTPWLLKLYDGSQDIVLGELDPNKHSFVATDPMTTAGDLIVEGNDGIPVRLAAGTAGHVLTSNGPGTLPSYQVNPIGVLTYSTSYTYKKDQVVIAVVYDETALYKSLIDNNVGNSLDDDTKWEKLALGGGGDNIGDIKYTTRTDVPNGGAWCNGAEYTQAMFPGIYQMLVDGKIQSTTYMDFNNQVSTNGYCSLFALNTATTSFKVPSLPDKYVIDTNTTASVVGNGRCLTFTTNGSDKWSMYQRSTPAGNLNGFSVYNPVIGSAGTEAGGSINTRNVGLTSNPSNSGLIADTSDLSKVVTLKAYVVLYSSSAEASGAQAAEFKNALGSKANVDLSNISANIDYVVERGESGNNWWEIYKSGKKRQGGILTTTSGTQTFPKPFSKVYGIFMQNMYKSAGTETNNQIITDYGNTSFYYSFKYGTCFWVAEGK